MAGKTGSVAAVATIPMTAIAKAFQYGLIYESSLAYRIRLLSGVVFVIEEGVLSLRRAVHGDQLTRSDP